MNIRVNLWLVLLVCLAFSADAAQRKPRYQKYAPEIYVQILERTLADETLPAGERSRLSVILASNYYKLKEFEREAELLEDALAAGITDTNLAAQAHYYLGRTYQALGSNEQAADQFEIVWTRFPGSQYHLHAAMELGDLALLGGDAEAATQWYQAIIDRQPKARLAFLARDKLRAISAGLSAEQITDESHRPVYVKDQLRQLDEYLYSQLYDKADALAQELIGSRTNAALRAAMNYHLAHHYWMYGHLEGADRFLNEAVNTTGDRRVEALILAGHVKRGLYQTDAALEYYRQAIQAAPAKPMTITAYAQATRLLLKSGRETEGLALAAAGKQAFTGKPELPAYLDRIANTLRDRAHPAWRDYAEAVAATATNELGRRALMQLGNEARLRRDWARAEKVYRELRDRPSASWRSTVDMQVRLLEAHLARTNTLAAAKTETKLLRSIGALPTEGSRAYVLYRLGKLWLANGQPAKAETFWRQILTAYPATGVARMAQLQVARLYESKGDLQGAISAYQTYLEMLAREEDTRYYRLAAYAHLIDLQNRTGRATLSAQLAQNALDTARSTGDPELLLDLSQYYWRSGHKELGKQLLQDGLHALAPMQKQGGTGGDLLRLEFKIFRRLYELGEYRTLLERWRNLEALRDDPTTRRHYWGCCAYYAALSLHRQGDIRSAKLLLSSGLEALESDAELTAQFVSALAMYTHWSEGVETARPLYEWAIAEQPRSVVANFGLLYLAVWEFNEGRVIEALSKAERILAVTKLKKGWRDTGDLLWSAQYVRGCCLKEMGMHREATALIAEAKRQKPNLAVYELLAGGE